MDWLWSGAVAANYLVVAFLIASILRRQMNPSAMLAWIFALLALPVLGILLYALLGSNRIRRKAGRRRRRAAGLLAAYRQTAQRQAAGNSPQVEAELPEDLAALERLSRRVAQMPATVGNQVQVYEEAEPTFAALEAGIREARDHVHLQYYIWQADDTGRHFRDLLIERARAGVRCRVLLDAVGCLTLRKSFTRPLLDAGVKLAYFLPLYPLPKRLSLHLRNHRKIAVIDGRVGFVGSQNIGDEYRGRLKALSPWFDSTLRIAGPAALFLQQVFAEDWFFATREALDAPEFFPPPEHAGASIVQVLATGPDQDFSALGQVIFAAVSAARHTVRIATPYFVPDAALLMALVQASFRGVRVQVVLPTRTDALLTLWAARSFYRELLEAGVELYEFDAGMLHAKIMTVDDRWCMLGSANMDVRSFRLNFEVTALVYDGAVAAGLARSIEQRCAAARRVTRREVFGRRLHQQLAEGAARLASPLL